MHEMTILNIEEINTHIITTYMMSLCRSVEYSVKFDCVFRYR